MKQQHGFTLIELVVVALLTAIAYPSYTRQLLKARRADGITALGHAALVMESCRADNAGDVGCEAALPGTSGEGFCIIAAAAPATAYSLIATPVTGSPQARDRQCTSLTLDSLGMRGYTGSAVDAVTCWGR